MVASRVLAIVLIGQLVCAFGCNNATQVAEYATKARDLIAKYSPQLAEVQVALPTLLARATALPDTVPGAAELVSLLSGQQETIATLQALLAALADRVTTAVREGRTEEADAALASAEQELDSGLSTLATTVDSATAQIAALEAKAQELAGFTAALPSGFELHGAADGVESKLIAFIEDTSKPLDENTWFSFDRLTFQTDSAQLDMSQSSEQITNIAQILAAYPTAKLEIGGYTDNAGDPKANKVLSQQRADAVVMALVAAGVDKGRLEAEGYGQEHPVCPANDTEECRAQNRRIDVSVRGR